ncbi:hypothetical protein GCM10011428_48110 [Streptomyces violaceus]
MTAVSAKAAEITATVALVQRSRGRGGLRGRVPGGRDLLRKTEWSQDDLAPLRGAGVSLEL